MKHGQYVNPGNSGFQVILNSEYIDKTGLIGQMNSRIDSSEGMVCISRPRRFGKSYAAKMLCAYYDSSCDSRELFDGRQISKTAGYADHINKYNVICFDVTGFLSDIVQRHGAVREVTDLIPNAIQKDLVALYPYLASEPTLADCLLQCVSKEGKKFVFIIDEWDAVIREARDEPETQLYPESGSCSLSDRHSSYQKGRLTVCDFGFHRVSDPLSGWFCGIYRVHGRRSPGALRPASPEF